MAKVPTSIFTRGDLSFRPYDALARWQGHSSPGFEIYPKGARNHWSRLGCLVCASDGKTWILKPSTGWTDARPTFEEAVALAIKTVEEARRRKTGIPGSRAL